MNWSVLTEIDRWTGWMPEFASARLEGPLAPGSVISWEPQGQVVESRLVVMERKLRMKNQPGFTRLSSLLKTTLALFTAFVFNANAAPFVDTFDQFNSSIWSCEYSCPTVSGSTAKFHVKKGIAPNNMGSWSKIRYKPKRFTVSLQHATPFREREAWKSLVPADRHGGRSLRRAIP